MSLASRSGSLASVPYLPDEPPTSCRSRRWHGSQTTPRSGPARSDTNATVRSKAERRRNRFNAANRRKAVVADRSLGRLSWAEIDCWQNGGTDGMAVVRGRQKRVGVRPEADVDLDHKTDTARAESRPRRCCSIVGAQFLQVVAFQSGLQNAVPYGLDILRREPSVVGPQMEDKSVRRSNISSRRRPVEDCESV